MSSGVIRGGEDGATNLAFSCIILILLDVLFLLEYVWVLYQKDDHAGEDEE